MFTHGLSAGYSSPKKVDSGAYPEWTCGLGRKTPTRGVHVSLKGNRCALEHVAVVGGLQQLTQWSRGAVQTELAAEQAWKDPVAYESQLTFLTSVHITKKDEEHCYALTSPQIVELFPLYGRELPFDCIVLGKKHDAMYIYITIKQDVIVTEQTCPGTALFGGPFFFCMNMLSVDQTF